MSVSPLSGAMAQPAAPEKKKKKRGGALLLISGIALTASLGGVFASSTIAINDTGDIEFGSGTEATTACDTSLTVALTQAWDAADNRFEVGDLVISGFDAATCDNQKLSVLLTNTAGAVQCSVDGTGAGDVTWTSAAGSAAANKFLLDLKDVPSSAVLTIDVPANCLSTNINKVALATS